MATNEHNEQEQTMLACSACERAIDPLVDELTTVEYHQRVYHIECFRCVACAKRFPVVDDDTSALNPSLLPIRDARGNLYCAHDFISTLRCHICTERFDAKSLMYKLDHAQQQQEQEQEQEEATTGGGGLDQDANCHLVHVECMNCQQCKAKISITNEYTFQICDTQPQQLVIYCKSCTYDRCQMNETRDATNRAATAAVTATAATSSHLRLSTRQKELIAAHLCNEPSAMTTSALDENSETVARMSREVGCSRRALVFYLHKSLRQRRQIVVSESSNSAVDDTMVVDTRRRDTIALMIQELNKLDQTIAPNKFPFGGQSSRLVSSTIDPRQHTCADANNNNNNADHLTPNGDGRHLCGSSGGGVGETLFL